MSYLVSNVILVGDGGIAVWPVGIVVPGTLPADPFILSDAVAAVKRPDEDSQKILVCQVEACFLSSLAQNGVWSVVGWFVT